MKIGLPRPSMFVKKGILLFVATMPLQWYGAPAFAQVGQTESLAAWQKIASVLQHPRCLNCHQVNVPLQGDSRRIHVPLVVRGPADHGVGAMTCESCHNASSNNETSRTPGAPHWQIAPRSMNWQGLNSAQLCTMLKDPKRNGNRDTKSLVEHMETEALVLWSWNPGAGREPAPMPHKEFVAQMKIWAAGGAACPK